LRFESVSGLGGDWGVERELEIPMRAAKLRKPVLGGTGGVEIEGNVGVGPETLLLGGSEEVLDELDDFRKWVGNAGLP
jgi:hypothetical protein